MTQRLTLAKHLAAIVFMGLSASPSHAASPSPSHFYDLNNSLTDAFGGPSLVAHGGSLSSSGYAFAPNQGLSLSGALPSASYTIDTSFLFDDTPDYRKIIDFKDLTADAGLYNLNSALSFYPPATSNVVSIGQDTAVRVTLSRDGNTGIVAGYVDGQFQFSFSDSEGLALFDGPQNIGHFFMDDNITGQSETSGGRVNYIAVYDQALLASDIANLPSAVPEPGSWLLALAGVGMVGWSLRRRG